VKVVGGAPHTGRTRTSESSIAFDVSAVVRWAAARIASWTDSHFPVRCCWAEFADARGTPYYQNPLSGEVMWEHPQVAFLCSVVSAVADTEQMLWPTPTAK